MIFSSEVAADNLTRRLRRQASYGDLRNQFAIPRHHRREVSAWIAANKANGEVQRSQLRRDPIGYTAPRKAVSEASNLNFRVDLCLSMTYLQLHQKTKLGVFGTGCRPNNQ
jgi:hypothetical protein